MSFATLETRISTVKHFLNSEVRKNKTNHNIAIMSLREIGYHMDVIHEIERVGLRHLSDFEELRLRRVLDTIEGQMSTNPSDN